jgi:6-phosphogluconolactonase
MEKVVEVLSDKQEVVNRTLELVVEKLQQAVEARGKATIALAGGSTPKPLYEALASQDLPLDKIHIFWGDERYVDVEHADSNFKMTREAWLNKVEIPIENIHPMPTDAGDPVVDAAKHEQELRDFFDVKAGEFPQFEVILLGTGDDAHTASLFPQTEALQVRDRLVTVGNKDGQPRLTLTIPLINQARCVIFLVSGENKQDAIAKIFDPDADPLTYPARFVQPVGELWWLLDQPAAAKLES